MKRCTVKTRHVPGSRAERECEVHGVSLRPRRVAATVPPLLTTVREHERKVEYLGDGTWVETWRLDGKRHRVDRPAQVRYGSDGTVWWESWYLDGKHHRKDGPARVDYRPDGTVRRERWRLDGKHHRKDGPAVAQYRADGTVETEWWWLDGRLHREDGPAQVDYRPDGTIEAEWWYLDGKHHREDGPAYVRYRSDGAVEAEEWWLGDNYVLREQVAALYLSEHFEPVSERNAGAIDVLLAQGPLTELSAEQVRLALTLYPEF